MDEHESSKTALDVTQNVLLLTNTLQKIYIKMSRIKERQV